MSLFATTSDQRITNAQQLADHFATGEKPREAWRIGTEHEKFPYRTATLAPISYEEAGGVHDILNAFQDYGWKPILDNGNIIGLTRGKGSITIEPGGQLELSGAPLETLHETAAEMDAHLLEACEIADRFGVGFLGMGFHPTASRDDIPWMPKSRYKIMRDYMPKRGSKGLDMMLRTCTVQVNLDYASEDDMVKKLRVSLALQPLATALFASSPFNEKRLSGFNSTRMQVWTDTDADRCGPLPLAFSDGFGYESYAQYALDVPMYFMNGKLPALMGELPTTSDWVNHLSTLFPDVRLKTYLEMRGADMGSGDMAIALPAFWVGLLYDQTTLDAAWDIVQNWTAEDRMTMHAEVPRFGLTAKLRNKPLEEFAKEFVTLSRNGLRRRAKRLHAGVDESRYLDPLFDILESGQNRAQQMMMQHDHFPDFSMEKLFEQNRLLPPQRTTEADEVRGL